jgi:hypothetical protein
MPPKVAVTTLLMVVTTLRIGRDTSISDDNLQVVIRG